MSVIGRFQDICDEVSGGRYAVKQETSSAEQTDHVFYASICKWLKPVFPEVSDEDTNSLATAGYVYFRFLLVFDDLLDGGQAPRDMHHSLHAGLALHEASIRKLAHLFGQSSPFWPEFQAVKAQYQEAIAREVELKRTQRPYTHADFEFVASGKSAMSLAATLGMSVLANRKNCVRTDLDHIYDDARWRLADV